MPRAHFCRATCVSMSKAGLESEKPALLNTPLGTANARFAQSDYFCLSALLARYCRCCCGFVFLFVVVVTIGHLIVFIAFSSQFRERHSSSYRHRFSKGATKQEIEEKTGRTSKERGALFAARHRITHTKRDRSSVALCTPSPHLLKCCCSFSLV